MPPDAGLVFPLSRGRDGDATIPANAEEVPADQDARHQRQPDDMPAVEADQRRGSGLAPADQHGVKRISG